MVLPFDKEEFSSFFELHHTKGPVAYIKRRLAEYWSGSRTPRRRRQLRQHAAQFGLAQHIIEDHLHALGLRKWGSNAFDNLLIVPPGVGIIHQVNLEYLSRVVFVSEDGVLYPDSVVGADSHTTMVNGSGVLGWGVGGIEAEAVILGQPISMVIPEVIGCELVGCLADTVTTTDLVLTITESLRVFGVVGKFIEFFGEGVASLSIADRATIANMCPEYGATVGFFPVDWRTVHYLLQSGRDESYCNRVENYLKANRMFVEYGDSQCKPTFTKILTFDLRLIVPSLSGPRRPQDRIDLSSLHKDFSSNLTTKFPFKGFGLRAEHLQKGTSIIKNGSIGNLTHGSVVIAAITSCTNTSNPGVMLAAGLVAKKRRNPHETL
ncbi:hypothetical protein RB195_022281 [Necator americanus]|uniref:Aconitase/3-isopropylmalate dehydratase large subunit alpha/beta/alpha domain-containing protein n=1 Tax=Necator americanus TaxID=51031 RepID=A0ABR1EEX4_NECAM